MSYLTQELLLLARLDKRLIIDIQPINLTELLENLVKLYSPQAAAKNIRLKAEVQVGLNLVGNAAMLIRAFTNLLQNALRYTPLGGHVKVKGHQTSSQVIVSVADTGIGIDTRDLEEIFERFWRVDKARNHEDGGIGLGLSITQAIIRSHGGNYS